jgi:hypothetical protein
MEPAGTLEEELVPLPTFPGKLNFPPGIDSNNTSALLNYLDELDYADTATTFGGIRE